MSEYSPIIPNENDRNVLVPVAGGRIEVMRLSNQFDESGRQIAYKLQEEGVHAITKAGPPEVYGEEIQSYYANELAMDRKPTQEQMERGNPAKATTDLGGAALDAVDLALSVNDASTTDKIHEHEINHQINLDMNAIVGVVTSLSSIAESTRSVTDGTQKQKLYMHLMHESYAAHDAVTAGNINRDSYLVLANTLIGSASDQASLESVFKMLKSADILSADELQDVASRVTVLNEINATTGQQAEQARVSYVNALISHSESILNDNENRADNRYTSLVGFIAGVSIRIGDHGTSSGLVSGAVDQLRKYS